MKTSTLTLTAILTLACAGSALAEGMQVSRNGSREGFIGSGEHFTGTAYVEPLFAANDPFRSNGGEVTFLPGARSNWHTHPAGQVIVVTGGTGWVQEEGGRKVVMQAGDVIWTPPGVRHWHGATDTTAVTHIAVQQFKDGENVIWGEPVSDEQYAGGTE
ncbi:cupin domain-containing protein [Arhodomonas aquaeolei]|uniref:(R)-mandelonitrile lyase n=1 Tax=Arhodomonas aquaeolei TaxID=2369 RepID=UPI00216A0297|nr:cupin domain-containing protein [Arhodomonas aquaeolei]MCS4504599.1 cupin domain-containing protein [Arhodomonas aquaeolei]